MCENSDWHVGSRLRDETDRGRSIPLVATFKIPQTDRDVVLDLYDESRRIVATGRSERYTRVEIIGIGTRSLDAERALFAAISDNLEAAGVPRHETRFFLVEPPAERWGIKGGVLASETDLGARQGANVVKAAGAADRVEGLPPNGRLLRPVSAIYGPHRPCPVFRRKLLPLDGLPAYFGFDSGGQSGRTFIGEPPLCTVGAAELACPPADGRMALFSIAMEFDV